MFIFGGELALIWKISLAKFEVHQVKGLREIARRGFEVLSLNEGLGGKTADVDHFASVCFFHSASKLPFSHIRTCFCLACFFFFFFAGLRFIF